MEHEWDHDGMTGWTRVDVANVIGDQRAWQVEYANREPDGTTSRELLRVEVEMPDGSGCSDDGGGRFCGDRHSCAA